MSEKRFNTNCYYINDTFYDGRKWLVNEVEVKEIVDVMNNLDMKARERSKALSKLQKSVDEQQATIRKLQDLCGESDGENAKLRIENKRLEKEVKLLKPTNIEQYEQIQKLQEENEKLRKELGDCEKFRYTVFKRLNDEHIKECSIR